MIAQWVNTINDMQEIELGMSTINRSKYMPDIKYGKNSCHLLHIYHIYPNEALTISSLRTGETRESKKCGIKIRCWNLDSSFSRSFLILSHSGLVEPERGKSDQGSSSAATTLTPLPRGGFFLILILISMFF